MLLPVALLLLALLAMACFAFGTLPAWGIYPHGIEIILWSRRLEWPLIVTAILLCIALLVLVITGRSRVWWLLGVFPLVAMCAHRITHGPASAFQTAQDPLFVAADKVQRLPDSDTVIGVIIEGVPCAFPCTSLFHTPVVIRTGRDKPMILFWSAWANRALAFNVDRELRASDLEIVSTPDDSLIVYNSRLGEFINATTGLTFSGAVPTNIHAPINVVKTSWLNWRTLHPDTLVAAIPGADGDFSAPQPEKDRLPGGDRTLADQRRVCIVACTQPLAVPIEKITDQPMNFTSGKSPILLVRVNGIVRAFSRELPGDLIPRFSSHADAKHSNVAWIDSDTNAEWSDTGAEITGVKEMHGLSLRALGVEDDVYLNVMKFWYPNLRLASDAEIAAATVVEPVPVEKPVVKRRRRVR